MVEAEHVRDLESSRHLSPLLGAMTINNTYVTVVIDIVPNATPPQLFLVP
jgi:hypothetical protein